MQDIDLEDTPQENGSRIWRQDRHISDQRIQTFRFSLAFLGVFVGALTWLLFQEVGSWIYTPLALLLVILSVVFARMEWHFAAQLRPARPLPRSQNVEAAGNGHSESGRAAKLRFASVGGEASFKTDAWPIYGAYTAFAVLGLYFGALPIWGRSLLPKPKAQTSHSEEESYGRANGNRRSPITPVGQSPSMPPGVRPPFGYPRQYPGATPLQVPPLVPPPVRTPAARQGPVASPAQATPPAGTLPPNSSQPKTTPTSATTAPPPNAGAPK